ncbi:putative secreted protein [Xanthomonas euvesicatoria pv. vesicatoria str. 85-10]|uniref:Putative secreted protein n=1 Tax=Xanthomonas euvesicatoria pv. vesicatoria (strain 85-10) TaxID=316273 RepID=Q3BN88_XANE5|nr:putative secreted protein [Xanthomonas euvesicatoria pv. vesicatoria str. 85-10]
MAGIARLTGTRPPKFCGAPPALTALAVARITAADARLGASAPGRSQAQTPHFSYHFNTAMYRCRTFLDCDPETG